MIKGENMLKLYVAIDVSDDDVTLAEVAQQCGYDVRHPQVADVTEPVVAHFHEQDCLMFGLILAEENVDTASIMQQAEVVLSHPSVSSVSKLGLSE
jgi:hypothetical protein